jgi:hypothetical protein
METKFPAFRNREPVSALAIIELLQIRNWHEQQYAAHAIAVLEYKTYSTFCYDFVVSDYGKVKIISLR